MKTVDWIAVDWGTTHLRAYGMQRDGSVIWSLSSRDGMGALSSDQFEQALLDLISDKIGTGPTQIIACGMVGSRQGWVEAPYAETPCAPMANSLTTAPTKSSQIHMKIVPGLRQLKPTADVMRGEETQVAGFMKTMPDWDGVLCMPGTHTKWVQISAGEVVSFQTFMTGEVFATLSEHSVLRHSIARDGWDQAAFLSGVDDALARPEKLAARLFSLRAEDLLTQQSPVIARSRLSGYLIGAELAAARPYWLGQNVALIGTQTLTEAYGEALSVQGVPCTYANGSEMTRAGLLAAYHQLKETTA